VAVVVWSETGFASCQPVVCVCVVVVVVGLLALLLRGDVFCGVNVTAAHLHRQEAV
jgi:hypothetical protein